MTSQKKISLAFATLLLMTSAAVQSAERDCVLEGTVKKQSADSDKVYVAFHSAKPAERGSRCKFRRDEKLRFKAPTGSDIQNATPGSKVEYRYTQDKEDNVTWKLRNVSDS